MLYVIWYILYVNCILYMLYIYYIYNYIYGKVKIRKLTLSKIFFKSWMLGFTDSKTMKVTFLCIRVRVTLHMYSKNPVTHSMH